MMQAYVESRRDKIMKCTVREVSVDSVHPPAGVECACVTAGEVK